VPTESCYQCVYAYWDLGRTVQGFWTGFVSRPACANHPESLGRMNPTPAGGVCRNYRPKAATPEGDVKRIPVGNGFYAYVDAADYEWLSQWTWQLCGGYAVRWKNKKRVYMHREIMQPPPGMIVDHINHNKLDNTRPNLRVCTRRENGRNKAKHPGSSSRFRGVSYNKNMRKWSAMLQSVGGYVWLGYFTDEVEAARAYDRAAVEHFGEYAHLNFPEDWPPERRQELYAQRDKARKAERRKVGRKNGKKRHEQAARRAEDRKAGRKEGKRNADSRKKRKGLKTRPPAGAKALPRQAP
jgi:hypothetical protein